MEILLSNQLYAVYAVLLLSFFLLDKPSKLSQKFVLIYLFILLIAYIEALDLKLVVFFFLICSYIYIEYLEEDLYKHLILSKNRYKMLDFVFILFIQNYFLFFLLGLLFQSTYLYEKISSVLPWFLGDILSNFVPIIFFFYTVNRLILCPFELKSYTLIFQDLWRNQVDNTFVPLNLDSYEKIDEKKANILIHLEDRTFLIRKSSYNFLCVDFMNYKLKNLRSNHQYLVQSNDDKINKFFILYATRKSLNVLKKLLTKIKNRKLYYRGFSTLEMQLIRTIGLKTGYDKKIIRKCEELIYSHLFFKGLKIYLLPQYDEVSDDKYKDFILSRYLYLANPLFNKKRYKNILSLYGVKYFTDLTDEQFFLGVLTLSNKLNVDNLNLNYITSNYKTFCHIFSFNEREINRAIDTFIPFKNLKKD